MPNRWKEKRCCTERSMMQPTKGSETRIAPAIAAPTPCCSCNSTWTCRPSTVYVVWGCLNANRPVVEEVEVAVATLVSKCRKGPATITVDACDVVSEALR